MISPKLTISKSNILLQDSSQCANGFAEAMVGVVKEILSKASASGEDPQLGLQAYRATPFNSKLKSPAEVLYTCLIRTQISIQTCQTIEQQSTREIQQAQKEEQKAAFDKHTRVYDELSLYQPVREN